MTNTDNSSVAAASSYLAAAPDGIIVTDDSGMIIQTNTKAEEIFGYSAAELGEMSVDQLLPDAKQGAHVHLRQSFHDSPRVRQMGDPGSRLHARRSDGSLVPVEIALSPIMVDGRITVMAVIRDVSARIEAESEHEMVRQSLDAIQDAVFMFHPESLEFVHVNEGAVRQVGYSRDELIGGMTAVDLKPAFTDESFREFLAPLIDDRERVLVVSTVHRRKDGTTVPVEINLQYPRTTVQPERTVVTVVRDITDRVAAEHTLRESEQAFRAAFDDAPVAMAITDLSEYGRREIMQVNRELNALLGYDGTELVGQFLDDLTHPDDRSRSSAGAEKVLADASSVYATEKRYLTSDGREVWTQMSMAKLLAGTDDTIGLIHIVDISRRIDAEQERDRREHTLAALAALRRATLNEEPVTLILEQLLVASRQVLEAEHAVMATPDEGGALYCRAMSSGSLPDQSGQPLKDDATGLEVYRNRTPRLVEHLGAESNVFDGAGSAQSEIGPAVVVPLLAGDLTEGVMVVARSRGESAFTDRDMEIASSLAAEAAVTFQLTRARSDKRRLILVEDRERIARDLHDLVIQRLFATGMRLQAGIGSPERLTERANETVHDLDETIGVIRDSIFQLRSQQLTLDQEIRQLVDNRRAVGRDRLELSISGDANQIPGGVAEHLLAALNEMLSNVSRHAQASKAVVEIEVTDRVIVTVTDDGIGMASGRSSGQGLHNIQQRAEDLGGNLSLTSSAGGTTARWRVPLE